MTAAIDAKETPSFFVQADRPVGEPRQKDAEKDGDDREPAGHAHA